MELFRASPRTERVPVPGENDAVTDSSRRSLRVSRTGTKRPQWGCLRLERETGRDLVFHRRRIQDSTMKCLQYENLGTAAPPMDLDPPASRAGRSAHRGRPLRPEKRPGWAPTDTTRRN